MSVVIGEFELLEAPAQETQSAPDASVGAEKPSAMSLTDLAELQRAMLERALRLHAD